jgi:hypothetical protein
MKVVQMKPVPMFSHVWLRQKSSKMTGFRLHENIKPVVMQWFQQQP